MIKLGNNNASTGSDGSMNDGLGGYSFRISKNSFTQKIWGHDQNIGHKRDMLPLTAEHGVGVGIFLLVYAMQIFYPQMLFSSELKILIDNSKVARIGHT